MIPIGIDYYPEHWDRALWEADADRMAELGVHAVRLAEFSWGVLEPAEGEFDFAWLDDAIAVFASRGMKVILGTPTNCAPRWMYADYPSTLQWGRDGQPTRLGIRGHRCQTSPVFRGFAERIVRKMAERYAGRPEIMAWQIDNEVERNVCTCPSCAEAFRGYLAAKHGTPEAASDAWGADVWSGQVSDWSQVQMPLGLGLEYKGDWLNPAYLLDWYRFGAASTAEFVAFQARIIREYDPAALITTNTCLSDSQPDFYQEFAELDIASYDNYPPSSMPDDPGELYSNAFSLDFVRGFKRKGFWVMEELGGEIGCWAPIQRALEPGMLEGYALQAVAHGADLLSFFRWRTSTSGAEMFCHGLLNHDDRENRRLRELRGLAERLRGLPGLEDTEVASQVALVYGGEQEFSLANQRQSETFSYPKQLRLLHAAAMNLGVNVDVVGEDAPLDEYKVVLLPCHFVTNPGLVRRLEGFVRGGGTLVVTNRSGVKDQNGNCVFGEPLPGALRGLCGCSVAEYDAIGPLAGQEIRTTSGRGYAIEGWCDLLELEGAGPWAVYATRFYTGTPAAAKNRCGAGVVYYLGTVGERELYRDLLLEVFAAQGIAVQTGLPVGVECCGRTGEGGEYRFFFNNTLRPKRSVIGGTRVEFEPLEVKILINGKEWG